MKNKKSKLNFIAKEFDLPEDLGKDGYHVEIMNSCVVVDGCKSVAEYGDGIIRLNVGKKSVGVIGNELLIKSFSCGQVTISGNVLCVELN